MEENKKNSENVSFDADIKIDIVETKKESKKDKLPYIIGLCVLIVIVIAGIIIIGTKDKTVTPGEENISDDMVLNNIDTSVNENNPLTEDEEYASLRDQLIADATTQLSPDVGNESPNDIVEPSTSGSQSTPEVPSADAQQVEKAEEQIKAFFDRKYHMTGAMYGTNGKGDSFSMSQDGEDLEAMSNLDGVEVSILRLDGVIYFKRPALKQYVELDESLMQFMQIDASFANFKFGDTNYETMKDKLVSTYDVKINGAPGVCYHYKNDKQQFKFFAQDGELKQIEIYNNATGEMTSQLMISYFTTSIPSDHLTLKGYTSSTIFKMFGDVLTEGL